MRKDLREEKGEDLRGEKALGGKGGKGSQQGEGGKHLREEKGKISEGERAFGGKGGMDLNRDRGCKNLRGEGGQGDNSKGTQIGKQACNVGGLSRRR